VPAGAALAEIYRAEGVRGLFKGNAAAVARIAPYSALHFGAFEIYARALRRAWGAASESLGLPAPPARGSREKNAAVNLAAGAAAGATAVLATYPLDLVRTRLAFIIEGVPTPGGVQVNPSGPRRPPRLAVLPTSEAAPAPPGPGESRKTMMGLLRIILERHGVRGLYAGLGPTMVGIVPYAGLKFLVYEGLKAEIALHGDAVAQVLPGMAPIGAGGGRAPAERASEAGAEGAGGTGPTAVAAPSAGEVAGGVLAGGTGGPARQGKLPLPALLAAGGAAGIVAQTVTYPLDVVRRRMQVQDSTAGRFQRYKGPKSSSLILEKEQIHVRSTLHGLRLIWQLHGWRALFSGLSINYIKAIPSTAVGFVSYDLAKEFLGVDSQKPSH